MMNTRKELLHKPLFIISLIVLLLNDHLFKALFNNWLTGKISDFAGLVVLPVFMVFLFPKLAKWSCQLSALFFIFWKTELSNGLIEVVNRNEFFTIGRVIDFTDILALLILPIAWITINAKAHPTRKITTLKGTPYIAVFTFIILTATSMVKIPTITPEGTIMIAQKHLLKVPKDTVLTRIRRLGYHYEISDQHYKISNIVVPKIIVGNRFKTNQDTIKTLTFSFIDFPYQPTKKQEKLGAQYLYIHEVTFSDTNTITDWKTMKKYRQLYNELTEELFAKKVTKK